jgi:hypothetical protein
MSRSGSGAPLRAGMKDSHWSDFWTISKCVSASRCDTPLGNMIIGPPSWSLVV